MPYIDPGYAATNALEDFLAKRAAAQRQAEQDALNKTRIEHEIQRLDADQKLKELDFEEKKRNKKQEEVQKRVDKLMEGDIPDADLTGEARKYGIAMPGKRDPSITIPGASTTVQLPGSDQPVTMGHEEPSQILPGSFRFAGQPAERQADMARQRAQELGGKIKQAPDRKSAGAIALAGGVPPASIDDVVNAFFGEENVPVMRHEGREGKVSRLVNGQWQPWTGDAPKNAKWVNEQYQPTGSPFQFVWTGDGLGVGNRGTGVVTPATTPTGDPVQPQDTAAMRGRQEARALVATSITEMNNLANQIITKIGPEQRLDAAKRGVAAVFGNDPQFSVYQRARHALAGNLAVAQQGSRPSNADIEAVWLPMIPDAYSDTRESANILWGMVRRMIGVDSTASSSTTSSTPAPRPPGVTVRRH